MPLFSKPNHWALEFEFWNMKNYLCITRNVCCMIRASNVYWWNWPHWFSQKFVLKGLGILSWKLSPFRRYSVLETNHPIDRGWECVKFYKTTHTPKKLENNCLRDKESTMVCKFAGKSTPRHLIWIKLVWAPIGCVRFSLIYNTQTTTDDHRQKTRE